MTSAYCSQCRKEKCGACRLTPVLKNSPYKDKILVELQNDAWTGVSISEWPRLFTGKHLEPGTVCYDQPDGTKKTYLLTREAIAQMRPSIEGKPIVGAAGNFDHKNVAPSDFEDGVVDGIVVEGFDCGDGWDGIKFMVWDPETKKRCIGGEYQLSCAYVPLDVLEEPGLWHNIPYDAVIKSGEYTHVAVVNNPRYAGAVIELANSLKGGMKTVNKVLKALLHQTVGLAVLKEITNSIEADEVKAAEAKKNAEDKAKLEAAEKKNAEIDVAALADLKKQILATENKDELLKLQANADEIEMRMSKRNAAVEVLGAIDAADLAGARAYADGVEDARAGRPQNRMKAGGFVAAYLRGYLHGESRNAMVADAGKDATEIDVARLKELRSAIAESKDEKAKESMNAEASALEEKLAKKNAAPPDPAVSGSAILNEERQPDTGTEAASPEGKARAARNADPDARSKYEDAIFKLAEAYKADGDRVKYDTGCREALDVLLAARKPAQNDGNVPPSKPEPGAPSLVAANASLSQKNAEPDSRDRAKYEDALSKLAAAYKIDGDRVKYDTERREAFDAFLAAGRLKNAEDEEQARLKKENARLQEKLNSLVRIRASEDARRKQYFEDLRNTAERRREPVGSPSVGVATPDDKQDLGRARYGS